MPCDSVLYIFNQWFFYDDMITVNHFSSYMHVYFSGWEAEVIIYEDMSAAAKYVDL